MTYTIKESLIELKLNKKNHIALWKRTTVKSSPHRNVLLTHGTFSNRKVLNGITDYLTQNGFTCWIFEWRNHGYSSKIKEKFNFETIGKEDFKIVFDHLFQVEKIPSVHCVTHSGGGICLTMYLINHPRYSSKIHSITMFACQAFGAGTTFKNYVKIWLGKWVSKLMGYVPAQKIGRAENESYYMMKQWYNWNLSGKFEGENGINYRTQMKKIDLPVLSIYGKGDQFIAPPTGCEIFLSYFENPSNQLLFCAKEKGFLEDYNHSRILHSRNARKEIYPRVIAWMDENDSHRVTSEATVALNA